MTRSLVPVVLLALCSMQAQAQEIVVVYADSTYTAADSLEHALSLAAETDALLIEIQPAEKYLLDIAREMHEIDHRLNGGGHQLNRSIESKRCIILEGIRYAKPDGPDKLYCYHFRYD